MNKILALAMLFSVATAQPFDFEQINLNKPFDKPLLFNSETPTVSVDVYIYGQLYTIPFPVHLYSFEITQISVLDLEANKDVYFRVCDNADFYGCMDTEKFELRNYSTVLYPGTHYLAIANNNLEIPLPFSTTVKIKRSSLQEESFSIKNIKSLPFSSGLFFHPSYNSRENGYNIEKVFKLVLEKETKISYATGESDLYVCTDKDLTNCTDRYWGNNMLVLQEGTHYLIFNDNGSYHFNRKYLDDFVRLEGFNDYEFTPITIPFENTHSFDNENQAFLYEFTLPENALLEFNANEDVIFNLYKDIYLKELISNYGYFPAGKYYLKIGSAKIGNYTANVKISKVPPETYSVTDMQLPFKESLYFNPLSNYRINSKDQMEKVYRLELTENTFINLDPSNPSLCIYADEDDLGSIIDCYDYLYNKYLALPAGTYYFAFNNDGYSNLYREASLTAFNGGFTEITEFPFMTQLAFNDNVPELWNYRTYLYKLVLSEDSPIYFSTDKVGNLTFSIYEDELLQKPIIERKLSAGTYYIRVRGNYGNYNATISIGNIEVEIPTGIAHNNSIKDLPKNAKAEIYNLNGKRMHGTLSKGIYIVKIGNKTFKMPVQ